MMAEGEKLEKNLLNRCVSGALDRKDKCASGFSAFRYRGSAGQEWR